IGARTIIWAAGNAASSLGASLGVPLDRQGRVIIGADLTIPGHREVMVIGDLAHFELENGTLLPGVSPVAMQQGRHAAANISAMILEGWPKPFVYFDKGMMATIGRHSAVADVGFLRFSGYPAWLAWLFVHLIFLVGFRNKLMVLFSWAYAYLFYGRGARLITKSARQSSDF
ncbi:MAG: dehydrogenase-like protein, partial [Chthoniobacteraceae bacterium]|nr:dehydrogenase-like protein [Chthoniobacteraceae bacterium]